MPLFKKKKPIDTPRRSNAQGTKISNYYASPAQTHSRPKIDSSKRGETKKEANSKKNNRVTLKNVGITILAGFFLYNLLYLRSDPIVVMDYETMTGRTAVYEPAIQDMLKSSIFNTNKLTLRTADLEKSIKSEFPEIQQAVVSPTLVGRRPVVHLRQQELVFTIESKGTSYIIASDGVVAGEASVFTGVENTTLIRDESGVDIRKGSRVLRSDDAEFFAITSELFSKKSREVELIRITAVPREAYIKIKGLSYDLRVYLDEPADVQVGTFFSAEKTLGERGEAPGLYMDLRAGEKVYWQ